MSTYKMTKLQKLISVCAGVHILASVFYVIMENQRYFVPSTWIPAIALIVMFPILFTIFIVGVLSDKEWLATGKTINNKKTKGHYFAIAIVTLLTFLSAISVFRFERISFDNSAELMNGILCFSILLGGLIMAVNTSDKKTGLVLVFLMSITLPMTLLLAIRSLTMLAATSMPTVFYFAGIVIYPPLIFLIMQMMHIKAHCVWLKEKRNYVIAALILGVLFLPAVKFAPYWVINMSKGNSTALITETWTPSNRVVLTDLTTKTVYDSDLGAYKTWVDLALYNNSSAGNREYMAQFLLPKGCFIIDYYLYVFDERKEGLLTDKRAASTIYEREVRRNVDPGIIYYENDDTIALKVYPFGPNEVRKTGFLVMHNESFNLDIDGRHVKITAKNAVETPIDLQGVSYVPASCTANGRSQIIITGKPGNYTGSAFENAILLYAKCSLYDLGALEQVNLVLDSFRHQVLSPLTAFSVWETEAQVRDLYELQADMLQNPEKYVRDSGQPLPAVSERGTMNDAEKWQDSDIPMMDAPMDFSWSVMEEDVAMPMESEAFNVPSSSLGLTARRLPITWWFVVEMQAIEWILWDIDVFMGMNFVLSFTTGIIVCGSILMSFKYRKDEA